MRKEIIVDELVRDAFIYEYQTPAVGLLVGSCNETGESCVVHLAQTLEEADPRPDEDGNPIEPVEPTLRQKSFTDINLATVSHHVKQVIRMLPGGLVVLGLFVVEPVDNIFTTKYEGILKSILTTMNKSLSRNPYYGAQFGKNSEKVVIHFHPTTKKFTVKQIDGQTFKTQQMDAVFSRLEWSKLESEYDTFYAMHLARADVGVPLKKNMMILMDTFHEILKEAIFIVNGRKPSKGDVYAEHLPRALDSGVSDGEDDLVGDHSESTGGGSGSSSPRHQCSDSGNESDAESPQNRPLSPLHILIEKVPGTVRTTTPGQDFITHLHLLGKIAVVAFVQKGSSTAFVVEMVKQDILRSLASRIEMHCESLIEEEQGTQAQLDEGTTRVYHEVPRRVFANLLGSKLRVSDYLFPGEGPTDSVASFRDILSLRLDDESDIMMTKEKPFNLDELRSKGSLEELICKGEPLVSLTTQRSFTLGMILGISVIVVVLGVVFSLFLKTDLFSFV